jgi:hypothetical protein
VRNDDVRNEALCGVEQLTDTFLDRTLGSRRRVTGNQLIQKDFHRTFLTYFETKHEFLEANEDGIQRVSARNLRLVMKKVLNIDDEPCASDFDEAVDVSILYEEADYYQIAVPHDLKFLRHYRPLQASALYHLTLVFFMVNGILVADEDDEDTLGTINAGKWLEKSIRPAVLSLYSLVAERRTSKVMTISKDGAMEMKIDGDRSVSLLSSRSFCPR